MTTTVITEATTTLMADKGITHLAGCWAVLAASSAVAEAITAPPTGPMVLIMVDTTADIITAMVTMVTTAIMVATTVDGKGLEEEDAELNVNCHWMAIEIGSGPHMINIWLDRCTSRV